MSNHSTIYKIFSPHRFGTLAIAIAGTMIFTILELPLPFLFGPMCACLIAALLGAPLQGIRPVSNAARTVLGVAVGASITPAVIHQLPQMAGSVAFVPAYIILIGLVGIPYFHRICGFDLPTSYYAAMPGGLQDMVLFGQEAGADVRALSLIHATRVLIIVTIVPAVLVFALDQPLVQPVGIPAFDLPPHEIMLMLAAAMGGWWLAARIGIFGAPILGPMIITTILSLTGIIEHRPPREAIFGAQFFIGMGIGVGYVGVTLGELRRIVLAGVVFVLILSVLTFSITWTIVQLGLASPVEGFLSFAPGGQAEMAVLAIIAGADLGFIVIHHIVRLTLVILGAPLVSAYLGMGKRGKSKHD